MNMQNLRQQEWKWIISAAALVLGLCLPVHATTITVCPTGCDYTFIQAAIDAAAADDTINVSPNSTGYAEALTLDKPVKIIGKKSNKTSDAWTTGTAGSSGGPLAGGTLMGSTLMGTTISYLNIQYCTVKMDANTKGLTVDYGNTLENTTISYCSFTGPAATADADWFAVSGSSSLPVDGGAVNGITVTYNTILQATSELRLDRDIANITYAHNTFSNSNGYIKLSKPYGGSGRVQGINVTFNTFNNSTKPFADEYAVAVADTVIETDANGPWGENLAIHFNNFLQDDAAGPYPIVGFQDSSRFTSEITATHNWWNSTSGPRIFVAGDPNTDTRPDVSERAGFDVPALRNFSLSSITGGLSGSVAPNMTKTITDPSINVQLLVKTNAGSGKVFAAKYAASPVASAVTSPLPGAAYYDVLLYPSSVSSIEAVTATIYYPTGTALASTAPVYWYSGITQTWISWDTSRRTVSSTPVTFNGTTYAGYVTIWADKNSTNPPLNRLTGTPVALSGSSVSTTTTTAATTTSSAGSSTTTTAATTTTSIGGTTTAKTTSSTSSVKPTTTTTAPLPRLTINPVSLNYGADKIVQTFTITNTGPGTLSWNINKEGINYDQGVDWIFDIT
ncbi:MAG: hypothetical protein NTV89_15550, partial [Proteobacteria bacterium]|nr:hypothetical protein [Pseudomonadota bacterium]